MPTPTFKSPRSFIEAGEVTLPSLYQWHARENPDYPLFRYRDGEHLNTITYAEAYRAVCRASTYVRSRVAIPQKATVAILANADTITYLCASVGIVRAGYIAFYISPRNGPEAVADLLRRTNARHLFVSHDAHISTLVKEATEKVEGVTLHPIQTFEDLFAPASDSEQSEFSEDFSQNDDVLSPGLILHSSGSTNHPKAVYWSHKRAVGYGTAPWYGEVNLTGLTIGAHGVPMFHAMGLGIHTSALCNGAIMSVFRPSTPPTVPTSGNVFEGAVVTGAHYVVTVPAFIEQWSHEPAKVERMQQMKGLIFGGAPLKQAVGDVLATKGVTLITCYGCTEVGFLGNFIPESLGMDWSYFYITPWIKTVQTDAGEGRYEIVVLSDPSCPLNMVNANVDGQDAYATNDLVEPHPTKPGMWKLFGRQDEQIILSNGEKTNPVPIEHIIHSDPHVASCIVFGHGKFQNGVLILPKPEFQVSSEDKKALEEFRNKIWPTIERANEFAPQHSRIFKEMIVIASPAKPFEVNAKGYPRRLPNLKLYHDEIESVYDEVEKSAQSDVVAPSYWDADSALAFVRVAVEKVMQKSVNDDVDLFRSGCDSLQATWIRNTILRAVRDTSSEAAKRLPTNVVFQAPTVNGLTDAVLSAVHGSSDISSTELTAEDLVRIAETYSSDLPLRPARLRPVTGVRDVVLVTGTTGGFGCDILEHLLRDNTVGMVYALNRKGANALERQYARFRERGLDEVLLASPKFKMVEGVLDAPGLGVDPVLLDEIRNSVTHIMHNAWRVDFNLALPSYEVDLKGIRNLVELALSSPFTIPPRIAFVSSVSVFGQCTIPTPVPEVALPPSSALDHGYSESKWVAEKVLQNVSARAGIPTVVVRVGQICGDRLGHWNEKEWFPVLVKSALFTRCLPDLDGDVTFIPSYPAARAFVEMRNSPVPFLHLVHPRPVPWRTLIAPIATTLGVPLVPYPAWVSALERSAGDDSVDALRENPALRLLDYFRTMVFAPGKEPMGVVYLSTEKAETVSEEFAGMPALGVKAANAWIAAWRKSGYLPTP